MLHKYLKSIGFSEVRNETEVSNLLDQLQEHFQHQAVYVTKKNGDRLWEIRAELSHGLGIMLSGFISRNGMLVRERYLPYIEEPEISSDVYCSIQRRVNGEEYSGLLDDTRVGIPIIFRLVNAGAYRQRKEQGQETAPRAVSLTAFSRNGKVLLPIKRNERQQELSKIADHAREQLVEAARHGDESAMESLNAEDMVMFSTVSRRMMTEDIYSIVDSCFMPQGIECEIYQVIGEILEVQERNNDLTGEKLWDFLVRTNDLPLHIVIHETDLEGEPKVGRRFKGTVWMQGTAVWEGPSLDSIRDFFQEMLRQAEIAAAGAEQKDQEAKPGTEQSGMGEMPASDRPGSGEPGENPEPDRPGTNED